MARWSAASPGSPAWETDAALLARVLEQSRSRPGTRCPFGGPHQPATRRLSCSAVHLRWSAHRRRICGCRHANPARRGGCQRRWPGCCRGTGFAGAAGVPRSAWPRMNAVACARISCVRWRRRRLRAALRSVPACCPSSQRRERRRAARGPGSVRRRHRTPEIELLARLFDLLGLDRSECIQPSARARRRRR